MKQFVFLISLILLSLSTFANDEYWQQKADYDIQVTLIPEQKMLVGEVEITYTNNANTHLDTIWLHLYPNAYSKYNTALAKQLLIHNNTKLDALDRSELGGIGKLDFTIDGQKADLMQDERNPDIAFIPLASPLLPNETIKIETPFKVKIPASVSRLGTDGRNFSVTQWYPKLAVFDDEGWHEMPYLDLGEFYADFGFYHVEITVPKNYKVASTGNKMNEIESDSGITMTFEQDKIHDFAWFASPDFKVKTDNVELPNGHIVEVNTFHVNEGKGWDKCNDMIKNSLLYFSEKIGTYPYDHCTVVEGLLESGGGMEYPMITVIQEMDDIGALEEVVAHEVAHNWWQGMLASNERRFPWIDEGFTTYYEKKYSEEASLFKYDPTAFVTKRKVAKFFGIADLNMEKGEKLVVRHEELMNRHQPIGTTSEDLTYFNYGLMLYAKAPHVIAYLEAYLGTEKFDACIQHFFQQNKFRHINPDNIKDHFERCAERSLDFIFEDWINSDALNDIRVKQVYTSDGETVIEINNIGETAIPVPVSIISSTDTVVVWTDGEETTFFTFPEIDLKQVIVDPENLSMDVNPANNSYKSKGFHKLERIHPQLFLGLDDSRKTELYFSPILAGNAHDKFMLGMSFYNRVFPVKKLEWNITPLYAFGSKQVNGIANFNYMQNVKKDKRVQLNYNLHFKTFSYDNSSLGGRYINLRPSISAKILSKDRNKKITHEVYLKHHHNWKELNTQNSADAPIIKSFSDRWVEELGYNFVRKDIKTPINTAVKVQFNNEHARIMAEANFKFRYGKLKSYISARYHIAGIIAKRDMFASSADAGFKSYSTNLAGQNGTQDYLFENYYFGRSVSDGFVSRQIFMNEGQFKFANSPNLLQSNILSSSINVRADIPGKWIPIKLYGDLGLIYSNRFANGGFSASSLFVFQAGAMLSFFDEAFEVYFPFISSSDIKDFIELQNISYKQRISFSINLDKMNPQKIIKGIEL